MFHVPNYSSLTLLVNHITYHRLQVTAVLSPHSDPGPLLLTPPYASMLGGAAVQISGPCFDPTYHYLCDFGSSSAAVPGVYLNQRELLCISPMLPVTGNVGFQLKILEKDKQTMYESSLVPFYSCKYIQTVSVVNILY